MITLEEALEGSSPLVSKVRARGPFEDREALVAAMHAVLPRLTEPEKIATLNAHPRIGEDPTRLSLRSRNEQNAGAASEQSADVLAELRRLNVEYETRFGFRFVVFVNRRPKHEILQVLRERLGRSRDEELNTGLEAIVEIAADRLRREP